jgi:hydrogenase maturation protease
MSALVVGLGSTDRGDDAVGSEVARAVAAQGIASVRVVEHEDPTALLDLWNGYDVVVVVDAVLSGAPAGTVHELETGEGAGPLPAQTWAATGRGGTHAIGVAEAIELARALHRLPARVVVVGVEAAGFEYGAPLSPSVAGAVPLATARVAAVLQEVTGHVPR